MGILFNTVNSNKGLFKTYVFVDFDSYYFGLVNHYRVTPDFEPLINEIKKYGDIQGIKVVGDKKEIPENAFSNVKLVTSEIIDGSDPLDRGRKYTDFILLDLIYQMYFTNPTIEQFVIVTGDSHFQSVVTFLKLRNKCVGVFGVKKAFSLELKNSAVWHSTIEANNNLSDKQKRDITYSLFNNHRIKFGENPERFLTFKRTAENISKIHKIDNIVAEALLTELIKKGYLVQEIRALYDGAERTVLTINWEMVDRDFSA